MMSTQVSLLLHSPSQAPPSSASFKEDDKEEVAFLTSSKRACYGGVSGTAGFDTTALTAGVYGDGSDHEGSGDSNSTVSGNGGDSDTSLTTPMDMPVQKSARFGSDSRDDWEPGECGELLGCDSYSYYDEGANSSGSSSQDIKESGGAGSSGVVDLSAGGASYDAASARMLSPSRPMTVATGNDDKKIVHDRLPSRSNAASLQDMSTEGDASCECLANAHSSTCLCARVIDAERKMKSLLDCFGMPGNQGGPPALGPPLGTPLLEHLAMTSPKMPVLTTPILSNTEFSSEPTVLRGRSHDKKARLKRGGKRMQDDHQCQQTNVLPSPIGEPTRVSLSSSPTNRKNVSNSLPMVPAIPPLYQRVADEDLQAMFSTPPTRSTVHAGGTAKDASTQTYHGDHSDDGDGMESDGSGSIVKSSVYGSSSEDVIETDMEMADLIDHVSPPSSAWRPDIPWAGEPLTHSHGLRPRSVAPLLDPLLLPTHRRADLPLTPDTPRSDGAWSSMPVGPAKSRREDYSSTSRPVGPVGGCWDNEGERVEESKYTCRDNVYPSGYAGYPGHPSYFTPGAPHDAPIAPVSSHQGKHDEPEGSVNQGESAYASHYPNPSIVPNSTRKDTDERVSGMGGDVTFGCGSTGDAFDLCLNHSFDHPVVPLPPTTSNGDGDGSKRIVTSGAVFSLAGGEPALTGQSSFDLGLNQDTSNGTHGDGGSTYQGDAAP